MTNSNDTKPQIKLNRKMRLWNKYRMVCITAAVIVALIIVVAAAAKGISKTRDKESVAAEPTTSAQQTSQVQEESSAPQTTEPATQQTTTAAVSSGSKLTVSGSATQEEFTSKDFYADAVFLGDSVMSGISSYGYLDNVYGNVNATSAKLESYVSTAMANKPSKVFIMVGHNDANYGTITEETLSDNIIDIVESIHKSSSTTKVYVLSVTPITSAYEKKTSINVEQSYLDKANELIEQKAAANDYIYIDVASAYKDNSGYMKTECTGNGINLNNSYYPFLLNGIASVVK